LTEGLFVGGAVRERTRISRTARCDGAIDCPAKPLALLLGQEIGHDHKAVGVEVIEDFVVHLAPSSRDPRSA